LQSQAKQHTAVVAGYKEELKSLKQQMVEQAQNLKVLKAS